MARPRSFNIEDALDVALNIFWTNGYRNASLDEIATRCGLSKTSLYAAFGDKENLFVRVLDRYHTTLLERLSRAFAREADPQQALRNWLESFVPYCSSAKGKRGCLSINAAADGNLGTAIEASILKYNTQMEQLIAGQLGSKRTHSKDRAFEALVSASLITTFYNGMMISNRRKRSENLIAAIDNVIRSVGDN